MKNRATRIALCGITCGAIELAIMSLTDNRILLALLTFVQMCAVVSIFDYIGKRK